MAAASEGNEAQTDPQADAAERFIVAGLDSMGLEADEAELAVIRVADSLWRPLIDKLLTDDLESVPPEPGTDVSGPPKEVDQ
jgi:hypothetical protein